MLSVLAFALLTWPSQASTQDTRAVLEVNGARAFAASPGGDLWICSRDGHAYVSHDWNRTWSEVEIPAHKPGEFGLGGDELEHLCFFDSKRAILAGYIGGNEKDSILRTEDGGETWSFVRLPCTEWIYDAQVTVDGHAWLVGSVGNLLASEDFGVTWRVAGTPFDDMYRSASVCFSTPQMGVVGALINAIKLTSDGGKSWTTIPSPADELIPADPDADKDRGSVMVKGKDGTTEFRELPPGNQDPVSRVWIVGDLLLAQQHGQIFHRSMAMSGHWVPLEIDGRKMIAAERVGEDLIVVGTDSRVSILSSNLEKKSRCETSLGEAPLAMSSGPQGSAFLTDVRGRVCTLTGDKLECSRLFSVGPDRKWEIASFDRARDGTLFGSSSSTLYRSTNAGRSWERLAEAESFESVHARADGSEVVVSRHGELCVWSQEHGAFSSLHLPPGDHGDLSISARKGHLWIAEGFLADKDEATQRMLRTSDTVLAGPQFTSLVFGSPDEGRTWTGIDRYVGAVVHASWIGSDDVLSLCMSDHSMRRGRLDAKTAGLASDCMEVAAAPGKELGGQWAAWLAFPEPLVGWVGGNFSFHNSVLHQSRDGGHTWEPVEPAKERVIEAFLLGGGACVRIVGFWHPQSRAEVWRDGKFEVIRTFEAGAHDAHVDAKGCLLVRLQNFEVWSLDKEGAEWTKLRTIEIPPR